MTLIMQFKNKNLSFIAGDGMITDWRTNSKTHRRVIEKVEFDEIKVFKCKNMVVGIFGENDKKLITWLNSKFNNFDDNDICNEFIKFITEEIKPNHTALDKEGVNIIFSVKQMFFFWSTKHQDVLPLGYGEHKLTSKEYFFSPQLNIDNEIDYQHQDLLSKLFKSSFKEVYNIEYNKELIKNDNNLNLLIKSFYAKVYKDPLAHKNCIQGNVRFATVLEGIPNEITSIYFKVPEDFIENLNFNS